VSFAASGGSHFRIAMSFAASGGLHICIAVSFAACGCKAHSKKTLRTAAGGEESCSFTCQLSEVIFVG